MLKFIKERRRRKEEMKHIDALSKSIVEAEKAPLDADAFRRMADAYAVCCEDLCNRMDALNGIKF